MWIERNDVEHPPTNVLDRNVNPQAEPWNPAVHAKLNMSIRTVSYLDVPVC